MWQQTSPHRTLRRAGHAALVAAVLAVTWGCAGASGDVIEARYVCDNGGSFTVAFDRRNERATVTFPTLRPLVLTQARSGSGFRYTDRRRELRGKGNEALWIEGDDTQLRCTTTAPPPAG